MLVLPVARVTCGRCVDERGNVLPRNLPILASWSDAPDCTIANILKVCTSLQRRSPPPTPPHRLMPRRPCALKCRAHRASCRSRLKRADTRLPSNAPTLRCFLLKRFASLRCCPHPAPSCATFACCCAREALPRQVNVALLSALTAIHFFRKIPLQRTGSSSQRSLVLLQQPRKDEIHVQHAVGQLGDFILSLLKPAVAP